MVELAGRSHIRHCNTVVAKVKCNVASPGDTGSSSEMKLLHTNNCTGISQTAVCNSSLIIREAYLTDFWEVSDTHCGAFFPHVKFPMDFILRSDRYVSCIHRSVFETFASYHTDMLGACILTCI